MIIQFIVENSFTISIVFKSFLFESKIMSIVEKITTPYEAQKGGYLNDVWNSLYNPDIIKSIEEDNLTIKAIIMLLETAIRSVKSVGNELKQAECEKASLQKSLQTSRAEKEILEQEIDGQLPCRQCPELQRKLTEQIKKTKDCKRSIQSIYALLKPTMSDNNVEETQRALVETQTIMGKYFIDNTIPDIIPETPGCTTKPVIRHASRSDQQKYQSELKTISHKEDYNSLNKKLTPIKESGGKKPEEKSPIIKSAKRTIKFKGSQENTSPDKSQKSTEPQKSSQGQTGNSSKLEWKLRADDSGHNNKQSSLKQATLSVKARPRVDVKRDLSMMDGFSGGTLPRKSSADKRDGDVQHCEADGDDYIAKSPGVDANCHSSLSLAKKRPRSSKEDPSEDQMPVIMTLDETHFEPMAASTCNVNQEEKKQKQNHSVSPRNQLKLNPSNRFPTSNLKKEQATTSSDFKYERGAVRKKSERLKLDGWSCDDCEKYYAKMEKGGMNASQIKRTMNKCSRHRNKFQKSSTPPDFWNPMFDTSDEDD